MEAGKPTDIGKYSTKLLSGTQREDTGQCECVVEQGSLRVLFVERQL